MACEAELAVRAMYNLERAQAEPLTELAQLLHRRPKPQLEAAASIPPPTSPLTTEQQTDVGGSLVELALRFAGRRLSSFSPPGNGHSQSMQLPRLRHGTHATPLSGSGPDFPLSAASRPSRAPSKSCLGPASTVNVIHDEEGDDEEGEVTYGCDVPSSKGGDAPRSSSREEVVAAASIAGVRNGPCMYIGQSRSEAQIAVVLDEEDDRALPSKMTTEALPGGAGCDFSPPASTEATEVWIAPGAGLEAVALRMGDFRYHCPWFCLGFCLGFCFFYRELPHIHSGIIVPGFFFLLVTASHTLTQEPHFYAPRCYQHIAFHVLCLALTAPFPPPSF